MKEDEISKSNESEKGEGEVAGELIGIVFAVGVLLLVAATYVIPIMVEYVGILGTGSMEVNVLDIIKALGVMILMFFLPFLTVKVGSILGKKVDESRDRKEKKKKGRK